MSVRKPLRLESLNAEQELKKFKENVRKMKDEFAINYNPKILGSFDPII